MKLATLPSCGFVGLAILCVPLVLEVRGARLQQEAQHPKWPLAGASSLHSDVGNLLSSLPFVRSRSSARAPFAAELDMVPKVPVVEAASVWTRDEAVHKVSVGGAAGLTPDKDVNFGKLGSGSHSTVYACWMPHAVVGAVKVMDLDDDEAKQHFQREINFFNAFSQEDYVVGYRGAIEGRTSEGRRGCIFMEQADGTLRDLMLQRIRENTTAAVNKDADLGMAVNVLRGLQTLAWEGFAHGDIVPSNLLIFERWGRGTPRVKFGDFGHAGPAEVLARRPTARRYPWSAQKRPYVAPELVTGSDMNESSAFFAADVWSTGMVLTELFTGSLPEAWEEHATEEGWRGRRGQRTWRMLDEHIQFNVQEPELRMLLRGMLQMDWFRRCSSTTALHIAESYAARRGVVPPGPPPGLAEKVERRAFAAPQDLANLVSDAVPWRWIF